MTSPFEIFSADQSMVVRPLEFISLDEAPDIKQIKKSPEEDLLTIQVQVLEKKFLAQRLEAEAEIGALKQTFETEKTALVSKAECNLNELRVQVMALTEQFRQQRLQYFTEVEGEIVSLAFAIAQRILHREIHLDPLVIRGVVRVALEKIDKESTVILHVPEQETEAWQQITAATKASLTIKGDQQLSPGDATLETTAGQIRLGITEQLLEIERGLFDLLSKRPS